jgi:hypothetical protein
MVDEHALQAAYNDAVAKGNKKLARELLALWRDTLPDRVAKRSLSRRGRSEAPGSPDVGARLGKSLG